MRREANRKSQVVKKDGKSTECMKSLLCSSSVSNSSQSFRYDNIAKRKFCLLDNRAIP